MRSTIPCHPFVSAHITAATTAAPPTFTAACMAVTTRPPLCLSWQSTPPITDHVDAYDPASLFGGDEIRSALNEATERAFTEHEPELHEILGIMASTEEDVTNAKAVQEDNMRLISQQMALLHESMTIMIQNLGAAHSANPALQAQ